MKKNVILLVALVVVGVVCFATAGCNRTEVAAASQPAPSSPVPDTQATATPTASASAPASTAPTASASVPESTAPKSAGQTAIKKAADANKHLFLFVSENDNEETATAKRAFETATGKLGDAVEWTFIDKNQTSEKALIEEFQLDRAPMPIILALAPNGVITGAYLGETLKDPQLQDSIAGPAQQQCLKALKERKLVFLCLQNATTKSNDAAMQGVNDFKSDSRFAKATEVITVDPTAAAEQTFLAKLKIDPKMTEATTAFLGPPGTLISKVTGATNKDALVTALTAASSGGCGPKGCGPKGCGPVK